MNVYKISAWDTGSYQDGQIISFYLTDQDLTDNEALEEWAEKNNRSTHPFVCSKINEKRIKDLRSNLIEEIGQKTRALEALDEVMQKLESMKKESGT